MRTPTLITFTTSFDLKLYRIPNTYTWNVRANCSESTVWLIHKNTFDRLPIPLAEWNVIEKENYSITYLNILIQICHGQWDISSRIHSMAWHEAENRTEKGPSRHLEIQLYFESMPEYQWFFSLAARNENPKRFVFYQYPFPYGLRPPAAR